MSLIFELIFFCSLVHLSKIKKSVLELIGGMAIKHVMSEENDTG